MTFWDFITNLFNWASDRISRILMTALGTVSILTLSGIIPEAHMKYYSLAAALLQYWRAQVITNVVTAAKTIVASQELSPAKIATTELPK
jgi:hypothetical protein